MRGELSEDGSSVKVIRAGADEDGSFGEAGKRRFSAKLRREGAKKSGRGNIRASSGRAWSYVSVNHTQVNLVRNGRQGPSVANTQQAAPLGEVSAFSTDLGKPLYMKAGFGFETSVLPPFMCCIHMLRHHTAFPRTLS
jgi:hypothetical protein